MNKRLSKTFGILFLLSELALVPLALKLMLDQPLSSLSPLRIVAIAMTFGSIALCIVMSFSSLSDNNSYPLHTFLFELIVFLCALTPLTEFLTVMLNTAGKPEVNMAVNTLYYLTGISLAYVIHLYEYLVINAKEKPHLKLFRILAAFLTVAGIAATLLNIRLGYFFTISQNGAYQSAPTFWLSYIAPFLLVVLIFITALREMQPGRQRRAFLFFWVFALISALIQGIRSDLSVQYTGYIMAVLVIYLNVQSELDTSLT